MSKASKVEHIRPEQSNLLLKFLQSGIEFPFSEAR
jgi:hypothetical protein